MADFNMSKLWLGKDGYYRDVNGNKIAQKGQALTGAAWRYLADKYGKDYANRTSMNTRNGNIFQNGRWRFNDVKSSREGRTATWDEANSRVEENAMAAGAKKLAGGYAQQNAFDGKTWYLNQDNKDRVHAAALKQQKSWQPNKPQSNKPDIWDRMREDGLLAGALESAGVDPTLAQVGSYGAYFIPGVGSVLAAGDAANSFARGNIGEGLLNTLYVIPGLGGSLKVAGAGLKGLGKATKLVSKVPKLSRIGKVSEPLINTGKDFKAISQNPRFLRNIGRMGKLGIAAGIGSALLPLFASEE